jgi:hypothetical protein
MNGEHAKTDFSSRRQKHFCLYSLLWVLRTPSIDKSIVASRLLLCAPGTPSIRGGIERGKLPTEEEGMQNCITFLLEGIRTRGEGRLHRGERGGNVLTGRRPPTVRKRRCKKEA